MIEDRVLVERFVDGDPDTVARVTEWIRYASVPFRRRLSGTEAEDVTQDVLVRLTQALRAGRFRGESSFETYVRRITSHLCIDGYRRGRRWQMVELDELQPRIARGREPSPFEQTRDRERLASFALVLAELPEHCRELWTMVLDGQSYEAMSERVGVRAATLRVRLLRCRRRAEELLGNSESGGNATTNEASVQA